MFDKNELEGRIMLDAAGLVALADLRTIQNRTALTGSSGPLDVLFLAPGIHCQQDAEEVNGGERPETGMLCAGLGGGYHVFRVENQATVFWLQGIAEPGKLINVRVSDSATARADIYHNFMGSGIVPTFLCLLGCCGTITVIALLGAAHDFWGFIVLLMLVCARVINVVVIRRRAVVGWKGAVSTDKHETDLLILLSKDRWVRMRGVSDDVKAIISGCWLRDMIVLERYATSFATVLVYASSALAGNATTVGSLMIGSLILVSAGLLGLANSQTKNLHMFGRVASVVGKAKGYQRKRNMVDELIKETGTSEWAYQLELIPRPTEAQKGMAYFIMRTNW